MYYTLSDNVYWVKGYSNSCLYDFNFSKLYWLNRELSAFIGKINDGVILIDELEPQQLNMCKNLAKESLLHIVNSPRKNSIDEIKQTSCVVDFAWIEITQKCNLKCIHCYNESAPKCNRNMEFEDYKLVVNTLVKMGVKRIQLIGGEPFAIPNLKKCSTIQLVSLILLRFSQMARL